MRNLLKMSLLTMCGICVLQVAAQTKNLATVYDGRINPKAARISAADAKIVETEVNRSKSFLREKSNVVCDENNFSVTDAATGAFTRSGAAQKAFTYELCRSGRSFGIGGIVIVENGKAVSHHAFGETGLYAGIKALPDINNNGINEILFLGSGTGQGFTDNVISIFENSSGDLKFLGNTIVYEDNYGTGQKSLQATGYKILAQTGDTPMFFRETFRQKGEKAKWLAIGKSKKISLENDAPKFYKVK